MLSRRSEPTLAVRISSRASETLVQRSRAGRSPPVPPGRLQPPGTPVRIGSPCSLHAPPVARRVQSLRGFGLVSVRRASDGVPRESDLEGWRARARVWWHCWPVLLVVSWDTVLSWTKGSGDLGGIQGHSWPWGRPRDWGALGVAKGRDGGASGTAPGNPSCPAVSSIWESGAARFCRSPAVQRAFGPPAWPALADLVLQELKVGPPASGTPRGPGRPQLCKV